MHDSEISMITLQERGKMYYFPLLLCIDEFVDHINGHLKPYYYFFIPPMIYDTINNQVGLHTPQIELQKARLSLYHSKKNCKCYEYRG